MLVCVGSGEYLEAMEAVDRQLLERLSQPARVVCLPTAAGQEGAERIAYWMQLGEQHFSRLGAQVQSLPVTDRFSAGQAQHAATVAGANLVYLSGGKPDYLYDSLVGTPVWEAIRQVLGRGGILAGCSAGAMIQGEVFFGFPRWKKGFNLLPGVTVVPHFDEMNATLLRFLLLPVMGRKTILGIEGNTALLVGGGQVEVLGGGGVTVWRGREKVRYTQGQRPIW